MNWVNQMIARKMMDMIFVIVKNDGGDADGSASGLSLLNESLVWLMIKYKAEMML